jgi:hypothetical protein
MSDEALHSSAVSFQLRMRLVTGEDWRDEVGENVVAKWVYLLAIPLALVQVPPRGAFAQAPPPTQPAPAAPTYSQAQLEQMLAPIALYPDDLLTQVLVASTYPLEVVMASRWLDQPGNKALKGDALLKALDAQDWDASVKSLIPFPTVLKSMNDHLDWTQTLGDAFLAQQGDVFAAVQTLRGRAQAAGKLQSNAQQTITQQGPAIIIQPAQPSVVYVPVYNPTVVYGAWPYPAYPPIYYPPPPGAYLGTALATGLAFGAGIAITSALWGWGRPNWNNGSVNVNVNRFNTINANQFNNYRSNTAAINSDTWRHNPDHRRGVAYPNNQTRQEFRPNSGANPASRDAFRGRNPSAPPGPAAGGARPGGGGGTPPNLQRPGGGGGTPSNPQRPGGGAPPARPQAPGGQRPSPPQNLQRPAGGAGNVQRPAGGAGNVQRPVGGAGNVQRPVGGAGNLQGRAPGARPGGGALQGVGNGAATRAQANQGRASRASMPQGGGGGRPGGGGGGRVNRGGRP